MRRKQLDEIMVGYSTYRNATEACKKRFLAHANSYEKREQIKPMDVQVRIAWLWFWRGWFRQ